jgi:hypothetical protein
MRYFKATISVGGREAYCVIREGVMATMELGSHANKIEKAEHKASIIISEGADGPIAWVQTADFTDQGKLSIASEGWVKAQGDAQTISSFGAVPSASFVEIDATSEDARKCAEETSFGPLACCTAYGNGCYVRCCGGCCSDPVRCPGASCCG